MGKMKLRQRTGQIRRSQSQQNKDQGWLLESFQLLKSFDIIQKVQTPTGLLYYFYRFADSASSGKVDIEVWNSFQSFSQEPFSYKANITIGFNPLCDFFILPQQLRISIQQQLIIQTMQKSYCRKTVDFILYTLLIYGCYISSGVYHQKILKHSYLNSRDQTLSTFDASIVFTLFPQLVCTMLGWIILKIQKKKNGIQPVYIPAEKAISCSIVINISMWTYNKAVQEASFPAVVMVKSCSLLSVILIALFCSRVKDKSLKLGKSKLWIGIVVTVGIFLFNFFKSQEGGNDKPLQLVSSCYLLISLLGDGLLPDLQAEIKSNYKPGVIDMYYNINKFTCLIAFVYSVITFQLPYIVTFIFQHPELQMDLIYFSFLNAVGQLVIYQMIKLFKQHIPPFVIATRKCVTVVVNIIHFGHKVNEKQIVGIILVFSAIMIEVYENYREKVKKEELEAKTAKVVMKYPELQINLEDKLATPAELQPLSGQQSLNEKNKTNENAQQDSLNEEIAQVESQAPEQEPLSPKKFMFETKRDRTLSEDNILQEAGTSD